MGQRLRFSRAARRAGSSVKICRSAARREWKASSSTSAGLCSATSRSAKRSASLFDFEWVNAKLFSGLYTRSKSFFDESDLSSVGHRGERGRAKAAGALSVKAVPARRHGGHSACHPISDGSGEDRAGARKSTVHTGDGRLPTGQRTTRSRDGVPLAFEIMVKDRNQERLGSELPRRFEAHRGRRHRATCRRSPVSATAPEIRFRRDDGSVACPPRHPVTSSARVGDRQARTQEASFNLAGVRDPAIDGLIDAMLGATTQEDFFTAVQGLRSGIACRALTSYRCFTRRTSGLPPR